jgi:hypothetical protein
VKTNSARQKKKEKKKKEKQKIEKIGKKEKEKKRKKKEKKFASDFFSPKMAKMAVLEMSVTSKSLMLIII